MVAKRKVNKLDSALQQKQLAISEQWHKFDRYVFESTKDMEDHMNYCDGLDLHTIRQHLDEDRVKPRDILLTYQRRVQNLHKTKSSGVCDFIQEAEGMALSLESRNVPVDQRSPLYGIPISIEEVCSFRGYDVTCNLVKRCNVPAHRTGALVQTLINEGAVPFVTTQTTQLQSSETGRSVIFGDLDNPIAEGFEPGGSNSGAAVLIARGGALLGVGTDVAGDLRIPAAFCGLTALKPTSSRLTTAGAEWLAEKAHVGVNLSIGPMAKRVEYLAAFMRTVLKPSMFELDITIPPIPFNETAYAQQGNRRLRIAYYNCFENDCLIQTVPAVKNAINAVVARLDAKQHHELVPFQPPMIQFAFKHFLQCFNADGGKTLLQLMADEELQTDNANLKQTLSGPAISRAFKAKYFSKRYGKQAALPAGAKTPGTRQGILGLLDKLKAYAEEFEQYMREFDAIVCPVWPTPGLPKDADPQWTHPGLVYTALYNLLDYPAGVVSVGKVSSSDIDLADQEAARLDRIKDKFNAQLMRMQTGTEGLPKAVQVVGKPFQEEVVLRLMKEIEEEFENERQNQ